MTPYNETIREADIGSRIHIIKRSGTRMEFDPEKIVHAIQKANTEIGLPTEQMPDEDIRKIASNIYNMAAKTNREFSVEEIQDMVEDHLMVSGKTKLARAYITYRYAHNKRRNKSTLDSKIESIINVKNEDVRQENSNKNPTVVSVQRDYMAGEWSRHYTNEYLLDEEIRNAHEEGIIHFHDSDYFAQKEHNCFTGDTKFITNKGVRKFRDFRPGDTVYVKDKNGITRKATVNMYGKQSMYDITLKNNKMEQHVKATENHRWILNDGTVTTSLKIGDKLYGVTNNTDYNLDSDEKKKMFCIGFLLGDGCDHGKHVQVRLCGEKTQHSDIFEQDGWSVRPIKNTDDLICTKSRMSKQDILNGKIWRYLSYEQQAYMFYGYYAADGHKNNNQIETSDERLYDFIETTSGMAGYYISSKIDITHSTEFKENATMRRYHFITQTPTNWLWTVTNIKKDRHGPVKAWCVEEPVTHTFLLEKGIVTGNCELINLEDMLQNGTKISGTMIETPKSFATCCTITSQIIAQVASMQYGLRKAAVL